MRGVDISHWNRVDWSKFNPDFLFIKATQGIAFVDPEFKENQLEARKKDIVLGYYHFAQGFTPKYEAQHFCRVVKPKKGELIALDWEIKHKHPVEWCLEWLKEVEKIQGFKPLIYLNEATVRRYDWSPVVKNDNGLWLAKYGWNSGWMGKPPKSYEWPFWAIWQYTSRGRIKGVKGWVDLNFTPMNKETLRKYGKQDDCNEIEEQYQRAKKEYKEAKKRYEELKAKRCQ